MEHQGLKTPVFLRFPARGNGIDDKVYSNPQKWRSNCLRKDKKNREQFKRGCHGSLLVLFCIFRRHAMTAQMRSDPAEIQTPC